MVGVDNFITINSLKPSDFGISIEIPENSNHVWGPPYKIVITIDNITLFTMRPE